MRTAVIFDDRVQNVIVRSPEAVWAAPGGATLVDLLGEKVAGPGWYYAHGKFSPREGRVTALSPSDDWVGAIEGGSDTVVTLGNGTYEGDLTISRRVSVLAENIGGAKIVGSIRAYPGHRVFWKGLNLQPPGAGSLLSIEAGWMEFMDCGVLAGDADTKTLMQVEGGIFRISARDRIATWEFGPGITQDCMDLEGCRVKVVGNVTGRYPVFMARGVPPVLRNIISADNCGIVLATAQFIQEDDRKRARAIHMRRGSTLTIQDTGNVFRGFEIALLYGQMSGGHAAGATFYACGTCIWETEGPPGRVAWNDCDMSSSSNGRGYRWTAGDSNWGSG